MSGMPEPVEVHPQHAERTAFADVPGNILDRKLRRQIT
jgi:hypothetical protein